MGNDTKLALLAHGVEWELLSIYNIHRSRSQSFNPFSPFYSQRTP
jgi:hypothetical protein